MWKLYLKDNEGVAIQSSKKSMYKGIESCKEDIGTSKVRYLDYEKDIFAHKHDYPHQGYNFITPLVHKRVEFAHENEFRMYEQSEDAISNEDYWEKQKHHKGKFIKIDIPTIVERIILPPNSDAKAEAKIKEITDKYGFNFEFYKSKLQSIPYY